MRPGLPTHNVQLPDGRNVRWDRLSAEVSHDGVQFPAVSADRDVQKYYECARLDGSSHISAVLGAFIHFIDGSYGTFITASVVPIAVRASYAEMRLKGQSHNMAEMLATRRFPGVKTDAIFNEGKFSGDDGRITAEQTWLRARAESAGVSTAGKWYSRGLASFPGDPTAWVGDRGDVLRVAREKNLNVHGYVEHQAHETDPGGDLPIAEEIVEDGVADYLDENPGADADAVRENVYALRSGAVDPNPLRVGDYDESYLRDD